MRLPGVRTIASFALACLASGCGIKAPSFAFIQSAPESGNTSGTGTSSESLSSLSASIPSALQGLPQLANVQVTPVSGGAYLTFDRYLGAQDYRVYALPTATAITQNSDHSLTIANAVYRCAGQTPLNPVALGWMNPQLSGTFEGSPYSRQVSDDLLGYVYKENIPGAGLIPVYQVGTPYVTGYNIDESIGRRYTSSSTTYQSLISQGWMDFGIAFYTTPNTGSGTVLVAMLES